jgi:hypothetical protein
MPQDIAELVAPYASADQARWVKLASTVQFRRLQLLLLRAILLELRKIRGSAEDRAEPTPR